MTAISFRADLVVSGINRGANLGYDITYSGTVAAAIEGAFFGITSVAVSLEFDEHAQFDKAAALAVTIIRQVLDQKGPGPRLYNLNIPTAALSGTPRVAVVPMDVVPYGESFEKRVDPWGRTYYWATGKPPPATEAQATDLAAIAQGLIALTPLGYDMTQRSVLGRMESWQFRLDGAGASAVPPPAGPQGPVVRTTRKLQSVVLSEENVSKEPEPEA